MKVLCVIGVSESGKTVTVENIIRELKARNYSVGSIKEIHHEGFYLDNSGSDTDRHMKAGSKTVTARGLYETDILFPRRLSVEEIMSFYNFDYVLLEGVRDINAPKIITAHSTCEIDERIDYSTFAVSGVIANSINDYRGLPAISSVTDISKLVDLIEEKVPPLLPDFDSGYCNACGLGCHTLLSKILSGEKKSEQCIAMSTSIDLRIDGRSIEMSPLAKKELQKVILDSIKGVKTCEKYKNIEISIKG